MITEYKLTVITQGLINRNAPRSRKMEVLNAIINPTKYKFMGFGLNGSVVKLKPKFHNIRDKKGRFTCKKK
jgi:hypothetical protein